MKLEFKDKYELQALHKALMEAKFHPEPNQPIVQTSPLVANVMNNVVEELEKINWVTEAERKLKGIEYKNDWGIWRTTVSKEIVLPVIIRNLEHIEMLRSKSDEQCLEYMNVLLSPYKLRDDEVFQLIDLANEQ